MAQTQQLLLEAHSQQGTDRQRSLRQAIELNIPVARSIAHRFRNRGEPVEDLEQVAYLGLTKAVKRFDPTRGDDFLSYAVPSITGEVKRHFRDAAWVVRPPRRLQELQGEMTPIIQDLMQRHGRSPRPSEIAEAMGRDVESVIEALCCDGCFQPSSLDAVATGDTATRLVERLGESEQGYERAEALAILGPALRELSPRDQKILYLRFVKQLTQEQVGREVNVTQMQVSRLLTRILRDLRKKIDGSLPIVPFDRAS